MTTKINLTYYGMSGEGATVREAKADAGRKLKSLVEDIGRAPSLIVVRQVQVLVLRTTEGWGSTLITYPGMKPRETGPIYPSGAYATFEDAYDAAARHAADLAWSHGVTDDDAAFAIKCVLAARVPAARRSAIVSGLTDHWAWQRRYRAARDTGMNDSEAHAAASGYSIAPSA